MEKLTGNSTERNKRFSIIDIAKGIGILFVILGHCVGGGGIHRWIYSFHMALFFFLSGMVFKKTTIRNLISKKSKSLLIPFFGFCIFGLVTTMLAPFWRGDLSWNGFLKDVYTMYPESIHLTSIWFLFGLFWVCLEAQFILNTKNTRTILVSTMILFLLEIIMTKSGFKSIVPYGELPLKIDSSFAFLPLFMAGFYSKELVQKPIPSVPTSIIGTAVALLASLLISRTNGTVYASVGQVNNPILFFAESCIGILFVFFLSFLLDRTIYLKCIFTWLGKNSLYILGFQAITYRLSVELINIICVSNYPINGLPPFWVMISFSATLAVSILLTVLFKSARSVLKKK